MPKITVQHSSKLDTDQAFEKIKSFFETDQDIRRLDSKMECSFNKESLAGKVKGSQFKADINLKKSNTGTDIVVVVDLPLLLTPFKGKVQETIEKKLAKYLV